MPRLCCRTSPPDPGCLSSPAPQVYVILVSGVTVALWCCNSIVQEYTGEMGVLAILPLVAFFGFGVLNKDDFNG